MKNLLFLFSLVLFSITAKAQVPQLMNYQAVARNSSGALLINQAIGLQFAILDSSSFGPTVYEETQTTTTNEYGLFTVSIGNGTVVSGVFANIDWGAGNKYLQIAMDPTGGTGYVSVGTSQLVSVPYALHARSAGLDWSILGNTGNASGDFLGTTDTQPLLIKLNNIQNGKLDVHGNIALGQSALAANTTGYSNVAIGTSALYTNLTGSNTVAIGDSAMYTMDAGGGQNTAIGNQAMFGSVSTVYGSTAIGYKALYANYYGTANTAIGAMTLSNDSGGTSNTAVGYFALYNNTYGNSNTAIGGYSTLSNNTTGSQNIAVGNVALEYNTTGSGNTALGTFALRFMNSGNNNTAVGVAALYSDTSNSGIVAVGDSSLFNLINGPENTALGNKALYATTTGNENVAVGSQALHNNVVGHENTAVGYESLYSNDTGSYNTAFGRNALYDNTTGLYNTAIGYVAYPTVDSLYNYTGLGFDVGYANSTSNSVEVGNTSVTRIVGEVAMTTYSDGRIKDNIQENVPGLAFINKLRPVTYNLNIHRQNDMMYAGKKDQADFPGKYDIEKTLMSGFVAQEVEQAAQAAGYDFSGVDKPTNADGLYGLRYSEFVVPLVKAVQELSQQVQDLKKQLEQANKK